MKRLVLFAVAFAAGCSVGPRYEKPAVEVPEAWPQTAPRFAEDGRWWRIYDDPELDKTIGGFGQQVGREFRGCRGVGVERYLGEARAHGRCRQGLNERLVQLRDSRQNLIGHIGKLRVDQDYSLRADLNSAVHACARQGHLSVAPAPRQRLRACLACLPASSDCSSKPLRGRFGTDRIYVPARFAAWA